MKSIFLPECDTDSSCFVVALSSLYNNISIAILLKILKLSFRSNNIMFSYKDDQLIEDDDPIIIDYQLVNFGHPVYDLLCSNLVPILVGLVGQGVVA